MNNRVYKKGLAVVLVVTIIIMSAVGIKLSCKEQEIAFSGYEDFNDKNETEKNSMNVFIFVDVDGAVNIPGVYQLKRGDRVNDAINMAGGLKEDAYTKNLNKARVLVDGEKIYIISKSEIVSTTNSSNSLININTASTNVLISLPGIGEVYAKRIIDYRNNKPFGSIEEIKNIEGIGDKTFDKIKDLITID